VIPSVRINGRMPAAASVLLILMGAAACAGSGPSTSPSASSEASEASSAAASVSPSPSEPIGERYASTSFAIPLTVIVEPLLKSPPIADTTNLLTWDAAADDNEKIRFLIPVEVYPPGGSPGPPPADYLAYLLGQASSGAEFTDQSTMTVDGHAATLLTATTTTGLNGSLGCPELGMDPGDEDCFGLQPEFILRIAVIDMGGGSTLLVWARTGIEAPDDEFNAMFERMLANLQFN
jgi:hypothetical protein